MVVVLSTTQLDLIIGHGGAVFFSGGKLQFWIVHLWATRPAMEGEGLYTTTGDTQTSNKISHFGHVTLFSVCFILRSARTFLEPYRFCGVASTLIGWPSAKKYCRGVVLQTFAFQVGHPNHGSSHNVHSK